MLHLPLCPHLSSSSTLSTLPRLCPRALSPMNQIKIIKKPVYNIHVDVVNLGPTCLQYSFVASNSKKQKDELSIMFLSMEMDLLTVYTDIVSLFSCHTLPLAFRL